MSYPRLPRPCCNHVATNDTSARHRHPLVHSGRVTRRRSSAVRHRLAPTRQLARASPRTIPLTWLSPPGAYMHASGQGPRMRDVVRHTAGSMPPTRGIGGRQVRVRLYLVPGAWGPARERLPRPYEIRRPGMGGRYGLGGVQVACPLPCGLGRNRGVEMSPDTRLPRM
jgi:hypothetical protein